MSAVLGARPGAPVVILYRRRGAGAGVGLALQRTGGRRALICVRCRDLRPGRGTLRDGERR